MYSYTTFAYAMLAFGFFPTVLTIPVKSDSSPHPLVKRAANCDARLGGLRLEDCRLAFNQIPHSQTPIQFQPGNPAPLAGLPYIWSVGECTIAADLIDPAGAEYITMLDIAFGAREIMNDCVSPSRIGGTYLAGSYDNFRVIIYQFDYADEENVEQGPDPTGKCSVKGGVNTDVATCVLEQASIFGFTGP
ncbi:MAG: hypothetical protein Q9164_006963 [Protoblastenia rupestris]